MEEVGVEVGGEGVVGGGMGGVGGDVELEEVVGVDVVIVVGKGGGEWCLGE